ncbi:MAG: D-alanyl-D-alanine carboxypeptidase [Armatimonadia bacterium]|nr:D-alanyl-D-alanine carboxypeptidase [Armatimonadia bacterium]
MRIPILAAVLCASLAGPGGAAPPPELTARSIVLMDGWTGEVLLEKDAHTRHAIASITKVMTALVVLDRCPLEQVVTVAREAAETGESSCLLKEGERLTVHQLLEMALMRSGNDAAVALAIHVSGSVPAFAALMNSKASELGLRDSHFTNPHGLDEEGHYQSAMDVAILCRRALENETFARIVAQPERTLQRTDFPDGYRVVNTNKLLRVRNDCIGIKTGWTDDAGYCLASAAQRGARRFVAVVLHSEDRFAESGLLLDWAFVTYVERVIVAGGLSTGDAEVTGGLADTVPVAAAETLVVVDRADAPLPEPRFEQTVFAAPIRAGQEIGYFELVIDGERVIVPAIATRSVRQSLVAALATWPNVGLILGCLGCGVLATGAMVWGRSAASGATHSPHSSVIPSSASAE